MEDSGRFDGRARVAVLDDDEDTRELVKDILQSDKTFTFAGGFSTGKEAVTAIPRLRPNFALVDIRLPDMDGIQCASYLSRLMPGLKIIVISGNRDTASFDRSRAAGASAYVVKPFESSQLIAALHLSRSPAVKSKRGEGPAFNMRDKAVLQKLSEGSLYKEIREALGISDSALRKSQRRIFKKLHVGNRTEAVNRWRNFSSGCC